MRNLLRALRGLWIQTQLSVPASIRHRAQSHLSDLKDLARLVTNPYLPILELSGQGKDGPLTVSFVNARFAKSELGRLLFLDRPAEREVGRIHFLRLRDLARARLGDLAVVGGNRRLIRQLPRRGAIVLPEYVHHTLDVSGDWPTVEGRIHSSLLRTELRRAQKYGYEMDVSRSDHDFEEFYRQMALPITRMRHGEQSRPIPLYEAYQYFRHGFLFRIWRDGRWVAGAVCQEDQRTLLGQVLGVRSGDPQEMKQGVIYALYYSVIRWANAHGYEAISFLGTVPYLESGLLQHKRRWGAELGVPPGERRQTWIQVRRETPAVSRFLKDNPLVIVDEDERLHGLIAVDDPAAITDEIREDWEKRYATPGLDSLIVRAVDSFVEPRRQDLVLPIHTANCRARESARNAGAPTQPARLGGKGEPTTEGGPQSLGLGSVERASVDQPLGPAVPE